VRSLFILSLPRSFSSETFRLARAALGLQEPIWTSEGEILNNDRSVLYQGKRFDEGLKFTRRETAPGDFAKVTAFLDQIVQPEGFIYKDVVQPFVSSDWLAGRRDLAVLKILPDLVHVASAVVARNWSYPAAASDGQGGRLRRIVQGLLQAEQAILAAPGEAVAFADLVSGRSSLRASLQRLYPEVPVGDLPEQTPAFLAKREAVSRRRADPAYAMIGKLVESLRGT
jgi:hypothetical protein